MDLLDNFGEIKSWYVLKTEYNLNYKFYLLWLQLNDAIPKAWKNIIQNNINKLTPSKLKIITLYEGPE